MIVVSDTISITNLIAIGRVELLRQVFGEVRIPDAVARELLVIHPVLPDFLVRCAVTDRVETDSLASLLDEGEAEAIVLAQEIGADYLLSDERKGRRFAKARGLRVIGVLGVLRQAKDRGIIAALRPLIDALEHESGFWISPLLREQTLRDAGEAEA